MDSIRVDIGYRPLRIGWAICAEDIAAFRTAVRTSYALWGGRFNPIIVVDRQDEAESLVDLFRVDVILPIGESSAVQSLPKRFPYLIKPFFYDSVFIDDGMGGGLSQVLDVLNAMTHLHRTPEWEAMEARGALLYSWEPDDPLANVFLMQLGDYPSPNDIHIDYKAHLRGAAQATALKIDPTSDLPSDIFERPSIAFLSRIGLERHYSVRPGWDHPGFYSGNCGNLDDLVCFWNLRAADIPLLFVDPNHFGRYGEAIASWDKAMQPLVAQQRFEHDRHLAVWARVADEQNTAEYLNEITRPFGGRAQIVCRVSEDSWNGHNVRPPTMHLGNVSTLGVIGTEFGRRKVSFALDDKPFSGDPYFHTQRLVASVSFTSGLYGDEQHTLHPPFIPELNEFYARTMHFQYDKLRSEPKRIGLIIDACDSSSFVYPLPVGDLFERVLHLAGFSAKLSAGGLITRQLIAQLGGVDGARAFKIPGVRRLLKTYGPTAPFSKKPALQLIGSPDPDNPGASFKDYEDLYIESRLPGTKLTPQAVFAYLVEKGLFRIGAELTCPNCRLPSWTALDVLKQRLTCELCGREFDATRQLVDGDWAYRRSGVLGTERNAQGAVPVVLTLQQFDFNLMMSTMNGGVYSPSLELEPKKGLDLPRCEIDFAWLIPQPYPDRTIAIVAECKDRGGSREQGKNVATINADDVEHLRRVADALPPKRFEVFVVLVKLRPFTAEEIALAKTLNHRYGHHVILLTTKELEPLHFDDRADPEVLKRIGYAHGVRKLAAATAEVYFKDRAAVVGASMLGT